MMKYKEIIVKIKNKLWQKGISKIKGKAFYPMIYKSYWHKSTKLKFSGSQQNYFGAKPNPGAGIGHQLANWIAGYWFAKVFNLNFVHFGFTSSRWEDFFSYGENECSVSDLRKHGYRQILLPLFDEDDQKQLDMIKRIIQSYANEKVFFVAEQDQYYGDQFGVMDIMKAKFYSSKHRKNETIAFSKQNFNIAIHIRRGDIGQGQKDGNPNLVMRWQNNDYYLNVLNSVLQNIKQSKPVHVYLFSQGHEIDFDDFNFIKNIHFCLTMNAQESFLHMVHADLLITSKSSFSYKPALLSNGVKICPSNFWHGYPESSDFILADDNGNFDANKLNLIS